MSNLYKQQFVIAQNEDARVINSNAIVAERLEELAHELHLPEQTGENEFVEGILSGSSENVIKQEEVDCSEIAKAEANQILMEAKEKADGLLDEAYRQSAKVLEDARQQGYQDGLERQQEELEQKKAQLDQDYQTKKDSLEQDYNCKFENMEQELVDVIVQVFNKVFHVQFDDKKEILLYLIEHAIRNIDGEKKFQIKTSNENAQYLQEHKEDILNEVGNEIELEITTDMTMNGSQCVLETESGVFDCGVDVQLENLTKDIRSLCS